MAGRRGDALLVAPVAGQGLQIVNQAIGWLQQLNWARNPTILALLLGIFAVGQTRGGGGGKDEKEVK